MHESHCRAVAFALQPPGRLTVAYGEPRWAPQADRIAHTCVEQLGGSTAVYVHGSAALGGFLPTSDLDVLVVSDGVTDLCGLGHRILRQGTPFPLELSIVARTCAAAPAAPWPFRLHVASPNRVVIDEGPGDRDLVAHYTVTRAAGIPIVGPTPRASIGEVARSTMLDYLVDELVWGKDHADQRYAVLNACRATAYARDGAILSKLAGGEWWSLRHGSAQLVSEALTAQRAGTELGACNPAARAFVDRAIRTLRQ